MLARGIAALTVVTAVGALSLGALGCSSSDDGSAAGGDNGCAQSANEALSVCATGPLTKGVDVSTYQGTVAWASVKAAGKSFAIARVSDGLNYPDAQFATNWSHIKSAGLVRGVYQFFRPGQDPVQQADFLLSKLAAAGGLQPGDMAPVLDIEVTDSVANATIQARAKAWLDHIQAQTGRKPIVYTAAFMSSAIGTALTAWPLWVANYGPTCPTLPTGWSNWKMWQYSSTGAVGGISGNVDVDEFQGTLADLLAFSDATPADAGAPSSDGGVARSDAGAGAGSGEPGAGEAPYGGSVVGGTEGASMGDGLRVSGSITVNGSGNCN